MNIICNRPKFRWFRSTGKSRATLLYAPCTIGKKKSALRTVLSLPVRMATGYCRTNLNQDDIGVYRHTKLYKMNNLVPYRPIVTPTLHKPDITCSKQNWYATRYTLQAAFIMYNCNLKHLLTDGRNTVKYLK